MFSLDHRLGAATGLTITVNGRGKGPRNHLAKTLEFAQSFDASQNAKTLLSYKNDEACHYDLAKVLDRTWFQSKLTHLCMSFSFNGKSG